MSRFLQGSILLLSFLLPYFALEWNQKLLSPARKPISFLIASTIPFGLIEIPTDAIAVTPSIQQEYGLQKGRLLKCKAKSNCISTSSINSVEKYAPPWTFSANPTDEYKQLLSIIQSDPFLKLVNQDDESLYIHAEAKSAFPPDGIDDLEFLINQQDKLITYRSNSRNIVYVGTEIVGDAGVNRNRLTQIQRKLQVEEMNYDNEVENYLKENDKLNFFEKLRRASEPSDINFVDNSVPES
jgi:uncharacterized protein (DUF1499 family)